MLVSISLAVSIVLFSLKNGDLQNHYLLILKGTRGTCVGRTSQQCVVVALRTSFLMHSYVIFASENRK